ncbi:MAG TPA: DUF393 domain-containing protein [Verrucomicrobiae bacterium]|nr:DUF393 domain-containing protein [Verrucomicrobiae bacterium]
MNTENTDNTGSDRGSWLFYDGDCGLCVRWARRIEPALTRRGYVVLPLQSAEVRQRLNLAEPELLREMRVITRDGRIHGGADAIIHLARAFPFGRCFAAIGRIPLINDLLRAGYCRVAQNRRCSGGRCRVPNRRCDWIGWLPLLIAVAVLMLFGWKLPAWVFMWTLCAALFAGCKWLVFWRAWLGSERPGILQGAGFLLGWIGMDAHAFFDTNAIVTAPRFREWLIPLIRTMAGAVLVWGVAGLLSDTLPLLAGWIGMFGLILLLHFGLFALLAQLWRRAGVDALPLMRAPLLAKTPGEFSGSRWNSGFRQLAHDFVFTPLRGRAQPACSCLLSQAWFTILSFRCRPAAASVCQPRISCCKASASLSSTHGAEENCCAAGMGACLQFWPQACRCSGCSIHRLYTTSCSRS